MKTMRGRILAGVAVAALAVATLPVSAPAAAKTTSTWAAPDLQPASYAKVIVLAKISDDVARRILEDAVVKGLADRGVTAVAGYQVLQPADLASAETAVTKARELGADAGIVFKVTDTKTSAPSSSNVHASVGIGVPVHAGPFSLFVGTSVPLGGGGAPVTTVGAKAEFFSEGTGGPRWAATFSTNLANGADGAAQDVAGQALKQIKKAGIFPKK